MTRRKKWNPKTKEAKIKNGEGQGEGANYKYWVGIRDAPSNKNLYRLYSHKLKRMVLAIAGAEPKYFYILEWNLGHVLTNGYVLTDIREQHPMFDQVMLDQTKFSTLSIADEAGIKHPELDKYPTIMTSDFCLTLTRGDEVRYLIRTVKPKSDLKWHKNGNANSTLQKFEIERRYWKKRGYDWKIVTEDQIPKIFSKNIETLREYYFREQLELPDLPLSFTELKERLSIQVVSSPNEALNEITSKFDHLYGFEEGTSLPIAYHCIACNLWQVNLHQQPFNPDLPIHILNSSAFSDRGEAK